MIQRLSSSEAASAVKRFAGHTKPVQGNNDLLVLTQPEAIAANSRRLPRCRCRHHLHNTFNASASRSPTTAWRTWRTK